MPDFRRIDIPEKDRALRADVSLLGTLLGDVLCEQHGPELLQKVEAVRKAAILQRQEGDSGGLQNVSWNHSTMNRSCWWSRPLPPT